MNEEEKEECNLCSLVDDICSSKKEENLDLRPHVKYLASAMIQMQKNMDNAHQAIFESQLMGSIFKAYQIIIFMKKNTMSLSQEAKKELQSVFRELLEWGDK